MHRTRFLKLLLSNSCAHLLSQLLPAQRPSKRPVRAHVVEAVNQAVGDHITAMAAKPVSVSVSLEALDTFRAPSPRRAEAGSVGHQHLRRQQGGPVNLRGVRDRLPTSPTGSEERSRASVSHGALRNQTHESALLTSRRQSGGYCILLRKLGGPHMEDRCLTGTAPAPRRSRPRTPWSRRAVPAGAGSAG